MESEQTETSAEGRRRALVVGVGRTPALAKDMHLARLFPVLECASEDVDLVGTALRQSRYEVRQLIDPGGFELLGALREFFEDCAPGDTAFLYLSCHGATLDGRDYLLPADAQPGPALPAGGRSLFDRTLIPADPDGLLQGLKTGTTAVICLDTCRSDDSPAPSGQRGRKVLTAAEDAYWLYSCSRGERSYADPKDGSWFGRALAKALAPTTRPTAFTDLVNYTRAAVRRTATDAGVRPPTIDRYVPHGRSEEASGPVLCDGAQEGYRWTTMIEQSALWEYTSGSDVVRERVKKRLGALVEHVADSLATEGAHGSDPWADPTYPVRVVERLEGLVKRARLDGRDLLSPAEAAVLLAAPVVHEGIVAIALEELRRTRPAGMDAKDPADDTCDSHDRLVRDAAHDVCRAHSQVRRTAATLRRRGLKDRTLAADHWLRHRFIVEWDLLWERTGHYPSIDHILDLLVTAILDAAEDATAAPVRDATRLAIDGQLRQVLGHLAVQPSSSPRINDARSGDEWNLYPPVPGNQWRAPELARLLWTAGLLAADPRRMSSVLVDHLGAHVQLDPAEVVAAVSADFGYDLTALDAQDCGTYELAVRFACPHPALHVAVEELAAHANATVGALHLECQKQRTTPPALLRGFPERITSEQLVPLADRYKQPLERFRLAEDEIRPLLMGTQLYGDRMLSVRELYQNALDACRYRDMRRQYGATQGRHGSDWQPKIRFTQGWDGDGRPYIECADNGSGMNRAKLTSMFARAGKRYEQDPEFVQERRNWRRAGLSEMPLNSRFGIGVFSYFMLAEEVVVWTSPVDHYGRPAQLEPLRADIQSGSGLLRISDDPQVALDGGTRVRLYLSEDEEHPPSLVETLESLLWVADFDVEAVEFGRDDAGGTVRQRRWKPGELTAPSPHPWRHQAVQGGPDIWLVQGPGQWLLDGVVVKGAPLALGQIVNLRERHRPEPSVDRNTLVSYDDHAVTEELLKATPRAAAQWTEVSLSWLWELSAKSPRLAVKVLDSLPSHTVAEIDPSQHSTRQQLPRAVPLAISGCLPVDNPDRSRSRWHRSAGEAEGWLLARWQDTRLATPHRAGPFLPPGYAKPTSMDSQLFLDGSPRGWETALWAASSLHVSIAEPVRALRRYAIAGFEVPAASDVRVLRATCPDPAMAHLSTAYRLARLREKVAAPAAAHAPLLLIAALHRLPLGEAVRLLDLLRVWQPDLPPAPELSEELAAEIPTRGDARALVTLELAIDSNEWLPGNVRLVDLLSRVSPSSPIHELMARIRHFEPLGFSLDADPSPAALEHGPLSPEERLLLTSNRINTLPQWRERDLSLADLLLLSYELQTPPNELAARLNDLSPVTGIQAPSPPPEARGWIPPGMARSVLQTLSRKQATIGPWQFISTLSNQRAGLGTESRYSAHDPDEIRDMLSTLDACSLLSPAFKGLIDRVVRQSTMPDSLLTDTDHFRPRAVLVRNEEGVTPVHLLRLSAREQRPIGEILEQLNSEEWLVPIHIAQPAPELHPLQVTMNDRDTLTGPEGFMPSLVTSDLLKHAHHARISLADSIEHLAKFTPLGAPAPPGDLTAPSATALREFTPDSFDLAAFGPTLLGPGALGPLELVRTAGRFGRPLGRTYDRYAPLACLGLDVTVRRPNPDEAELIPEWQDLVILTEQLTGRAPALTGTVTEDHISLCAEETGLSVPDVRARLQQYAALFTLRLPSEEGITE
ncbi:HD domain-containing protein [Streptomyces avermitilis]|uniref:HD domain-containing protein n=1 Tax=Streptomyces avermitilis TaxID=33903 RepID=UPI003822BF2C